MLAIRWRRRTPPGAGVPATVVDGGHQDGPDPLDRPAHDRVVERELRGLGPHAVHVVDEQDRVVDHDAEHHDHPDVGLAREGRPGVEEDQVDPDQRHRHREDHAQRPEEGLEERGRHHVDEQERDREHHPDLLSVLLADEVAVSTLLDRVPGRHVRAGDDGLVDDVAETRRPPELVGHGPFVLLVLTPDPGQQLPLVDPHDVPEPDAPPAGRRNERLLQPEHVQVLVARELHLDLHLVAPELQVAQPRVPRRRRADPLDHVLDGHVVAREPVPVDLQDELRSPVSLEPARRRIGVDLRPRGSAAASRLPMSSAMSRTRS